MYVIKFVLKSIENQIIPTLRFYEFPKDKIIKLQNMLDGLDRKMIRLVGVLC